MAGWHHRFDGHEFEWTPEVGDEQGGLACCDSWGRKESGMTEQLNWTEPFITNLGSVKQHWFIISQFCRCGVQVGSLGCLLGVPQAEIRVSASLCTYPEVEGKDLLTDGLKLAEFSSLWLWSWDLHLPAGCQLGSFSAPRCLPCFLSLWPHLQDTNGHQIPPMLWVSLTSPFAFKGTWDSPWNLLDNPGSPAYIKIN